MLSPEALEAYRRMSPGERLALMLEGSPMVVARRFERLRAENDARNRNILEGLARAEGRTDDRA